MDGKGNQNKGRIAVYQVLIKHRGVLNDSYLEKLKNKIWEFLGDVSLDDITIRKSNQGRK